MGNESPGSRWMLALLATPLVIALIGTFWMWPTLPDLMSVHFTIARVPTTSVSTWIVVSALCSITGLTAILGMYWTRKPVAGDRLPFTGFLAWASMALLLCLEVVHIGVPNWQDVIGPGLWLLAPGVLGMAAAVALRRLETA
jgi:hypothetical protein